MQRRTLLKLGLASGVALALAGGGAALFYERAWRDGHLTPAGRRVVGAVARGVLDGSLPTESAARQVALAAHLDRMETTLSALPKWTQLELADLLAVLALAPGRIALSGLASDWSSASVTEIQASLQTMRISRIGLRQQSYHALRDLTHAAYFADSATWAMLGYPGPTKIE